MGNEESSIPVFLEYFFVLRNSFPSKQKNKNSCTLPSDKTFSEAFKYERTVFFPPTKPELLIKIRFQHIKLFVPFVRRP